MTLERNHPEHKLIEKYISNSHEIKEGFVTNIFALERKGDIEEENKNFLSKAFLTFFIFQSKSKAKPREWKDGKTNQTK